MARRAKSQKAWAGRMEESTHPVVEAFSTSFPFDRRLWEEDIRGSIAHCRMLMRQRIVSQRDGRTIVRGLREIHAELAEGRFRAQPADEDIHMAIERRLIEKVGAVGGKLHTARSRNDQVALDLRLHLREAVDRIQRRIERLVAALMTLAQQNPNVILPGYTHLQQAQPVLLAHHLLAYMEMLERDRDRLRDCRKRINVLPLGSGALSGTTFPIDRESVAAELGFAAVSRNSMDAVSDRDFVAEFLADAAILGMHLSRLAEEIVLWASQEFAFIVLPDAFATGSSMMPQKKNPDIAELVRGKTGRLYGNLVALLTIMKGLPLTYNRDLQEDKEPVFDSIDTLDGCLDVMAELVPRLRIRAPRMREVTTRGHTLATELADYLATRGVPFREAHAIVGRIVRDAITADRTLESFTPAELRAYASAFANDVEEWLSLEAAVGRRRATGGTAPENVRRELRRRKPRRREG